MSTPRREVEALILGGSGTPWKTAENQTISLSPNTRFQNKVLVQFLNRYVLFHSAVEDEVTAQANLGKKHFEMMVAANRLRPGKDLHKQFLAKLKEQSDIKFKGGLQTASYRTYAQSDDTTTAIPTIIWNALLPILQQHVLPGQLKANPCTFDGAQYMSVADIGPILGALGQREFWDLVRVTASKIKKYRKRPIKIYHQVTWALTPFSDPFEAPAKTFEGDRPLHLFTPNGIDNPAPSTSSIPQTEDFLCLPEDPTRPVSAIYDDYVGTLSTRLGLFEQFWDWHKEREKTIPNANVIPFALSAKEIAQRIPDRCIRLVQPNIGSMTVGRHGKVIVDNKAKETLAGIPIRKRAADPLTQPVEFMNNRSMDFNFKSGANTPQAADLLVYLPFDKSDKAARIYNSLVFKDGCVSESIDSRYHLPFIVMNYRGCYDEFLDCHTSYARNGYVKDFILPETQSPRGLIDLDISGVTHSKYFFMDVISGDNMARLQRGADHLVRFYSNQIYRIPAKKRGFRSTGVPRDPNMCGVVVFASASSDKLVNYKNGVEIGRTVAELKAGLTTGGGDQHLMWAPIEGYNQAREAGHSHLSCISTYAIVKVETIFGRMPECDYSELHDQIGSRLFSPDEKHHSLMKNDILVSIGGGDGTGEETNMFFLMKHFMPDLMRDKKMIFIGTDESMHKEISSVVGEDALQKLLHDPYACENEGFYLFANAEDAKPLIRRAVYEFNRSNAKMKIQPSYPLPKVA